MLDREELIRKYRAIPTAEAQFIALCIEQFQPRSDQPTDAFKIVADQFGLATPSRK